MKKIINVFLLILMIVSISGCHQKTEDEINYEKASVIAKRINQNLKSTKYTSEDIRDALIKEFYPGFQLINDTTFSYPVDFFDKEGRSKKYAVLYPKRYGANIYRSGQVFQKQNEVSELISNFASVDEKTKEDFEIYDFKTADIKDEAESKLYGTNPDTDLSLVYNTNKRSHFMLNMRISKHDCIGESYLIPDVFKQLELPE